jgi:FtsZ-binding cell division protein ZapB
VAVEDETGFARVWRGIRPLTVAGAAQVGAVKVSPCFLLPVELRHANHTASTNVLILDRKLSQNPTMTRMSADQIEQIAERVERLLVRYEELQRTNALLAQQVEALTTERDSLKSRLHAARARVDALLERLPEIQKAA